MEALDKLRERQAMMLPQTILDPPTINSAADIVRLVQELDPQNSRADDVVPFVTNIKIDNEIYEVKSETVSRSRRSVLIHGMENIKKTKDLGHMTPSVIWLDKLIERWFNGYRDGLYICWDLHGKKYKYDIFKHTLTYNG